MNHHLDLAPLPATGGWFQYSVHAGQELQNGLWVGIYSTAALALAGGTPDGGNNMFVKADWGRPKYLPK